MFFEMSLNYSGFGLRPIEASRVADKAITNAYFCKQRGAQASACLLMKEMEHDAGPTRRRPEPSPEESMREGKEGTAAAGRCPMAMRGRASRRGQASARRQAAGTGDRAANSRRTEFDPSCGLGKPLLAMLRGRLASTALAATPTIDDTLALAPRDCTALRRGSRH